MQDCIRSGTTWPDRAIRGRAGSQWAVFALAVAIVFTSAFPALADEPPSGSPFEPIAETEDTKGAVFKKFPDRVLCVAFSPDGGRLAAGSFEVTRLFATVPASETGKLPEPSGFVRSLAWSHNGQWLAVGGYQSITLWDAAKQEKVHVFKGHRSYVTGLAFSADGTTLVSSSEDATVRIWKTDSHELTATLKGFELPALAIALSPDGKRVAACSGDTTRPNKAGEVLIWPATGEGEPLRFKAGDKALAALTWSADSGRLAVGSFDELIYIFEVQASAAKPVQVLEGHSRPITSLAFFPGKQVLLSAAGGRFQGKQAVKVWNLATGKATATLEPHAGTINQIALSRDGNWLATAGSDKTARLMHIAELVKDLPATPVPAADPAASAIPAGDKPEAPPPATEPKTDAEPKPDAAPKAPDSRPEAPSP